MQPTETETPLKPFAYALALGLATAQLASAALAADITGAGATFPFPVYSKWAEAYRKETGTGLNYQSIVPAAASSRSRPRPWISVPPMRP